MHPRKYAFMLACAALVLCLAAFPAQSADEPDFVLGDIVVKGEKPGVEDIAIKNEISGQRIEATGSKTLAEALRYAPGITVTRGSKNEPEISIHGFGTEKSLFLIDGIPYYETYYGKLNLDQIPTEIISRIEITKNAPSVLYGPNTQIAVINVITKKGTEEPSFAFTQELGENGTRRNTVSHGNQVGNINYWLSYSRQETDGWRMSNDFDPQPAEPRKPFMGDPQVLEDGGYRDNADLEKDAFWGRIGITPDRDSEYFLSMHVVQSEKGIPYKTDEYKVWPERGDEPAFTDFGRFENYDDWGIDLSGKKTVLPWLTLRGKLFYHEHTDDLVSYGDPELTEKLAVSTYDDSYTGISLITDIDPADWYTGHFSIHYKQDVHEDRAGENLPFNKSESYTGSLGTEHEFFSENGITGVIGASLDWFDVTEAETTPFKEENDYRFAGQEDRKNADPDAEFNPLAGLSWHLSDAARIYGSVAKKTRFPTLNQLYSDSSGNADLDSEQSINYTLGAQRTFGGIFRLRAEGFFHDISDWISRDYSDADYMDSVYINVEDVEMTGAEIGFAFTPAADFRASLDYTYNDAENKSPGAITDKVAGVPENKYVIGIDAVIPGIETKLALQGIYVDKIYENLPTPEDPDEAITSSDDHFTVDARLSRKIGQNFTAYLECENLFDRDYESEIGFPGPGRNAIIGMKASF